MMSQVTSFEWKQNNTFYIWHLKTISFKEKAGVKWPVGLPKRNTERPENHSGQTGLSRCEQDSQDRLKK